MWRQEQIKSSAFRWSILQGNLPCGAAESEQKWTPREIKLPDLINEQQGFWVSHYTFIHIKLDGWGQSLTNDPPKPVNSTWWRRRDADTFRCSVYKNTLPEKDFCSMVLLLWLPNGTIHLKKSCVFQPLLSKFPPQNEIAGADRKQKLGNENSKGAWIKNSTTCASLFQEYLRK